MSVSVDTVDPIHILLYHVYTVLGIVDFVEDVKKNFMEENV